MTDNIPDDVVPDTITDEFVHDVVPDMRAKAVRQMIESVVYLGQLVEDVRRQVELEPDRADFWRSEADYWELRRMDAADHAREMLRSLGVTARGGHVAAPTDPAPRQPPSL